ncbi:LacI family DNA-binding transcriptional regulator [Nonomuraea sp. NPDC051941]|uniref:LacI family DNA-binding transcriptional regulator n=1 Tax=Nonomuraea sp. NPDC051941 TaxID=3364373 RepID=UPI0037C66FE1
MPSNPGRSTLATIAASAGVSVATVSKVLNGRTDVAPATRSMVQSLLQEHGYVARRSRRTRTAAPATVQVITIGSEPAPAQLAALSRARLPVVVVDPLNLPDTPVTSVGATNFAGGMSATRHLLDLGHRRIAYLGGIADAACNQARMHGYRAAMEAAGVPVPAEYVRTSGFRYPDGETGGAALLDLRLPPTAIFAAGDGSALGAMQARRSSPATSSSPPS